MSDNRSLLTITGSDAQSFLQGLVTNDVDKIDQGLVYAAILTPQGKYLADFFLSRHGDGILLDVHESLAVMLKTRLSMYKLRADVTIEDCMLHVHRGLGDAPEDAFQDPRADTLGWRAYRPEVQADDTVDWAALQVAASVPQSGVELGPDSYILEMGFERLSGVDFRKGCYVGQEVTARMKHKTELRKGLVRVSIKGTAEPGTQITADGKPAGILHSVADGKALAYLRFNRAKGKLMAGEAEVILDEA
ncbi:MAG: folate-binding protein YgfZ [Cognatishimia sp.]|uniref:CAF17-like 4Fe-4S cluster assembly/insertion protein YgfZ n=1 Tax=Cognatishimia sp. TaxID=2211648 RepID=UPI003B8AF457